MECAASISAILHLVGFTLSSVQVISKVRTSLDALESIKDLLNVLTANLIYLQTLEKLELDHEKLLLHFEVFLLQETLSVLKKDIAKLYQLCQKHENTKDSKWKRLCWTLHDVQLFHEYSTRLRHTQSCLFPIISTIQLFVLPDTLGPLPADIDVGDLQRSIGMSVEL